MSEEKKLKILKEEDFIDYPKFKNSLSRLIQKYPEGVDGAIIAKVLNMTEEEVEKTYDTAIEKIKKKLGL
jgi:hypothetical protein